MKLSKIVKEKFSKPLIYFLIIFFIFSFFRFYNLEKRIGFAWDQERDAFIIKDLIINHKLTLIGPRVVSDTGFFLGPYYYYLLLPFYFFSRLDPKAIIYFVYFFNILFFISCFFIIKKLFSPLVASLFLLFWSVNLYLIKIDIISWNVLLIPLGILFNWWLIFQLSRETGTRKIFLLGFLNGFFLNFHFQFIFINFFTLVYIFLLFKKKKFKNSLWFYYFFGFLITFIPLLIFDLRHNFLNIKLMTNWFLGQKKTLGIDRGIWLQVWGYFLSSIIFSSKIYLVKFFYLFFGLLLFFLIKIKKGFYQLFYQSTLILWFVFPLAFIIYGQRPSEYYFLFLLPFVFLGIIDFFITINKKNLLLIYLLSLIIFNRIKLNKALNNSSFSLFYKIKTVKKINELTRGKKFNLSISAPIGQNNGFSYLIDFYQVKKTNNWQDPLVEIRIPPEETDIKINDDIGIRIPKELDSENN